MMNKGISSTIIAVICLTAAFLIIACSTRPAAEESPGSPKIIYMYGNVSTYPENGKWQALTKDTTFKGNDWIYAGPNSYVIFSLNGNDIVTVTNDTLCAVYPPDSSPGGGSRQWKKLYLQYGRMWLSLPESQGDSNQIEVLTPTASVTTKGAVMGVSKDRNEKLPEEYLVSTGSASVTKDKKTIALNEKERVIIMAAQALPSQPTKVRSFNMSEWEKWNLQKDTLMQKGDSKALTTMEPPKTAAAASGSTGKTGTSSSGQSSGSGATQAPSTGGSNFDYQQVRDRIRVPPAYKP
jgi:hypothetical protein